MDIKTLKLQLINRLMETDDPAILETISRILALAGQQQAGSPPESSGRESSTLSSEAKDLQQSIDDIFGEKG